MKRFGMPKRIAACLLAMLLTVTTFIGCGTDSTQTGSTDNGNTDKAPASGEAAQDETSETAMGRYVEKETDLGDNSLTDWNSRVFPMADGSFLLSDNSGFVLRSQDNGASWVKEDLPWLKQMKEDDKYILTMAFGPDQTAAVIWTEPEENSGEDGNGVHLKMDMQLTIVKPDGTEIPTNIELEPDDLWVNGVCISDTGRIIVSTISSNLYEVKEDGSSEKFLAVADGVPSLVRFHGNIMLLDGAGFSVPLLYDMEEKAYIEDQVLTDFVKENFANRVSNSGRSYEMFLVSGGDDAIYLAGNTGIYRHVLGGSAMEQVVDGSLTILGDPTCQIMDMLVADNDEFVVILTGEQMTRFVYDPNVPSRPSEKLQVWSLEDEMVIRQAISLYQKENPAVYVEYEIGLEGNSMTREDAIKNLNTRTMAGKGPDVLVLDNMPMDSYVEKGILMDIAPLLDGMSGEEAVFPNVVDAFRQDGHVYMVPCGIQLPYVHGRTEDINKVTDMSSFINIMEDLRTQNPGSDLLRLSSPKAIMRVLSLTCAPAWRTEEGTLNAEAISDFLTQTKQIYDIQMDGLSEEALQAWEGEKEFYLSYESVNGEDFEETDAIRIRNQSIYFMSQAQQIAAGSMDNINAYNCQLSLPKSEGFEDCGSVPMNGQCSNVFWAKTLLGINASSENTDRAQDFIKTALSTKVQIDVENSFPVTPKAILDNYADQWQLYKDNDYVSGSSGTIDSDGYEVLLLIRVPDEAEVKELIQWIASMDTAYVEDKTFENVIYEEGTSYMLGEKSLEDAMNSIETRLGIYLAE